MTVSTAIPAARGSTPHTPQVVIPKPDAATAVDVGAATSAAVPAGPHRRRPVTAAATTAVTAPGPALGAAAPASPAPALDQQLQQLTLTRPSEAAASAVAPATGGGRRGRARVAPTPLRTTQFVCSYFFLVGLAAEHIIHAIINLMCIFLSFYVFIFFFSTGPLAVSRRRLWSPHWPHRAPLHSCTHFSPRPRPCRLT
jgi:hypothetical protein